MSTSGVVAIHTSVSDHSWWLIIDDSLQSPAVSEPELLYKEEGSSHVSTFELSPCWNAGMKNKIANDVMEVNFQ